MGSGGVYIGALTGVGVVEPKGSQRSVPSFTDRPLRLGSKRAEKPAATTKGCALLGNIARETSRPGGWHPYKTARNAQAERVTARRDEHSFDTPVARATPAPRTRLRSSGVTSPVESNRHSFDPRVRHLGGAMGVEADEPANASTPTEKTVGAAGKPQLQRPQAGQCEASHFHAFNEICAPERATESRAGMNQPAMGTAVLPHEAPALCGRDTAFAAAAWRDDTRSRDRASFGGVASRPTRIKGAISGPNFPARTAREGMSAQRQPGQDRPAAFTSTRMEAHMSTLHFAPDSDHGRGLYRQTLEAEQRPHQDDTPEVEAELDDEGGDEVPAPDLFVCDSDIFTPGYPDSFTAIECPIVQGDVTTGMVAGLCFALFLLVCCVGYFVAVAERVTVEEHAAYAEVVIDR